MVYYLRGDVRKKGDKVEEALGLLHELLDDDGSPPIVKEWITLEVQVVA